MQELPASLKVANNKYLFDSNIAQLFCYFRSGPAFIQKDNYIVIMKVSIRLNLGFALVLLMLAALMSVGFCRLNSIGTRNSQIIDQDWAKAQALNIITRDNARPSLERWVVTDNSVDRGNYLTFLPPMLQTSNK